MSIHALRDLLRSECTTFLWDKYGSDLTITREEWMVQNDMSQFWWLHNDTSSDDLIFFYQTLISWTRNYQKIT